MPDDGPQTPETGGNAAAQPPFDESREKHLNELVKEKHRRTIEWIAVGIIGLAFAVSIVGLFTACEEAARIWFQTIFTTILGAAIAYALKKDH